MKRSMKDTHSAASRAAKKPTVTQASPTTTTVVSLATAEVETTSPLSTSRHGLEFDVQHQLRTTPGLEFESLVVRRVPEGVCLEGVLKSGADGCELADLARKVTGVTRVLDRVVRMPKVDAP